MTTYYLLNVGYSEDEEGDGLVVGQEIRINFEELKLKTKIEAIEEFEVDTDEEGGAKSERFVILTLKKEDLV